MATDITRCIEELFETDDGIKAHRRVKQLVTAWKQGCEKAKQGLVRYVRSGQLNHVRTHVTSQLSEQAREGDSELAVTFKEGLADDATRYWCIEGLIKVSGSGAYEEISRIGLSSEYRIEDRAKAIKCLALQSGQLFDMGLDSDPGRWKLGDLRTRELQDWKEQGYPTGPGRREPQCHPALSNPKTRFETIVSNLDQRLSQLRAAEQDLANPSNWLIPAKAQDIEAITARWKLPASYLDFLTRFSPLNVNVEVGDIYNCIELFGASTLIEGQLGYAINGISGEPIADCRLLMSLLHTQVVIPMLWIFRNPMALTRQC